MLKKETWSSDEFSQVKIEMNDISNLVGQLLTIADASFQDKQQREAVKSLIKNTVWDWGREWHIAATSENIKWIEENSEDCVNGDEVQIPHLS
jgi:hypothetical protein